jgi:hypothetical protein
VPQYILFFVGFAMMCAYAITVNTYLVCPIILTWKLAENNLFGEKKKPTVDLGNLVGFKKQDG